MAAHNRAPGIQFVLPFLFLGIIVLIEMLSIPKFVVVVCILCLSAVMLYDVLFGDQPVDTSWDAVYTSSCPSPALTDPTCEWFPVEAAEEETHFLRNRVLSARKENGKLKLKARKTKGSGIVSLTADQIVKLDGKLADAIQSGFDSPTDCLTPLTTTPIGSPTPSSETDSPGLEIYEPRSES